MEKGVFIADLQPGTEGSGIFMLASAQQGQAKNGPYWRLELRDASGSLEGKIWFPQSQNYTDLQAGSLVEVSGRIGTYKERVEIALDSLRVLPETERALLNLSDFVIASKRKPEDMLQELKDVCTDVFTYAPWSKFARLVLKDEEIVPRFLEAPAAVSMHHTYAGGLLEHTLSVCKLCMLMADHYSTLDRQALLAGALCHDLGKIWELSYGLATDYTDSGRLLGHISLGLEKLDPLMRKAGLDDALREHLKHLIVSHHGTREFGSPCLPATAEALLLHYADNIDAKVNQVGAALEVVPEGQNGWSAYVKGLDRYVYKSVRTPEPAVEARPAKARAKKVKPQEAQQCLSLLKE